MQGGCLNGTRVTVRTRPAEDQILSPVHIRAGNREAVHLTGVTQDASVTVRLGSKHGRVSVTGETTGADRFSVSRYYRPCVRRARPRTGRPEPTFSGGGEG